MSDKIKVMTILGTRPDIIRLARVIPLLEEHTDHILVHTGQNYDYELNEIFFKEMNIKKPNYFLEADITSMAKFMGSVLIKIEEVLLKEKPDAVLILGDVNSTICSIIVKRMKIPLYHMEAGNRSFDLNVPEEINRKIIDHTSDINFVYTEHARRNLLREGIHPRFIYLSGSPMKEVLDYYMKDIDKSDILKTLNLKEKKYFVATLHRESNVDNSENLKSLVKTLNLVTEKYDMPIILSVHPRTRNRMERVKDLKLDKRIITSKPFGFFDFNKLQKHAFCVLSDSGSISEESAIIGFPAITMRPAIERTEAIDTGNIILTGIDTDTILNAIEIVTKTPLNRNIPFEYQITNTSERVVKFIIGTAKVIPTWTGVIKNDLTYKQ